MNVIETVVDTTIKIHLRNDTFPFPAG